MRGAEVTRRIDGKKIAERGRIWVLALVLCCASAGGIVGYLAGEEIRPVYQSRTTLLVGSLSRSPEIVKNDLDTSTLLASTYATLIRSQVVLGSVTRRLHLPVSWEELKHQVQAYVGTNGIPLVEVSVTASSSAEAREIAATIADRAVGISPTFGAPPTSEIRYGMRRVARLEHAIERAQQEIGPLKDRLASVGGVAAGSRLSSRILGLQQQVMKWQRNYLASTHFLAAASSSNLLQVLEPASAGGGPIRPKRAIDAALGAAVGALLGIGLVLGSRRERGLELYVERERGAARPESGNGPYTGPDPGHRPHRDPWVSELAEFGRHRS